MQRPAVFPDRADTEKSHRMRCFASYGSFLLGQGRRWCAVSTNEVKPVPCSVGAYVRPAACSGKSPAACWGNGSACQNFYTPCRETDRHPRTRFRIGLPLVSAYWEGIPGLSGQDMPCFKECWPGRRWLSVWRTKCWPVRRQLVARVLPPFLS